MPMLIKIKSSVLLVVLFNILIGQAQPISSQMLGISLYQSSSNNSYLQFKPIDIIGNGIYTMAEFHAPHFSLINSMYATTDKAAASKGSNKEVKGIYGYTNQAVVKLRFSVDQFHNQLILGRDYFDFGLGKNSTLFLSNQSRRFDQIQWCYEYKNISGGIIGIQLENIGNIKRYLTAHIFKLKLPNKMELLWGESILYTGVNRSVEWQYFNPVLLWTPEMVNSTTGDANGMLYAGLAIQMIPTYEFWGEILVDDYQINHEVTGDLEPNEIGLIAGLQKTGFPQPSSKWWLEYTQITNRTYQTPKPEETFTHRGFPIGHYLGNDFDLIHCHYEQQLPVQLLSNVKWLKPDNISYYCDIAYIRDGANGLDTPFDTPWMDSTITMETGYSEPFPTEPIIYVTELETGLDFYFNDDSYFNAGLFWQRKALAGKIENHYSIVFRLWLSLSKTFNY